VQFDDLFKIAWEEDAANKALQEGGVQQSAEDEGTKGICSSRMSIFSWQIVIAKRLWAVITIIATMTLLHFCAFVNSLLFLVKIFIFRWQKLANKKLMCGKVLLRL
jgi:hypothetical protein